MIKFSGLTDGGRNIQTVQRTKYILSTVPSNSITLNEQELIPIDVGGHLVSNSSISVNELGKQLLKAAANGDADEIKKLLSKGAPFTADWLGTSPLHLAAQNNHLDVAEILLRAGISKDARTKVDRTPLHMAAYEGHLQIVDTLIQHGAEIDCKDLLGMTPLHWAVQNGHLEIVEYLLQHGADINAMNKFDLTPIMISKQINRLDIENSLEYGFVNTKDATQNLVIQLAAEDSLHTGGDAQILNDEDIEMIEANSEEPIIIPLPPSIINQFQQVQDTSKVNEHSQEEPDSQFEDTLAKTSEQLVQSVNIDTTNLTDSLKLLQEHGITMLQNDNDTNILNTVMESGHSVVLTDVGKQVLNSVKQSEQQQQQTVQKERKMFTITPEEFLAMSSDSGTKCVQPMKIRRVVMKKNKLTPVSTVQHVNPEVPSVSTNGTTSFNDMELVMSQLVEARKTIEEMKVKLQKKEQEAERYKMQLKLLLDPS